MIAERTAERPHRGEDGEFRYPLQIVTNDRMGFARFETVGYVVGDGELERRLDRLQGWLR